MREPPARSSRSVSAADEDGPRLRGPGPVHHRAAPRSWSRSCATNLERRGFRVDVANVPFKWYPVSELVRQALAWRLLDVTESNGTPVDLVIPTKFPSYLVRHPRKVAWLFHQHREAYDLFGTPYCSFTDTPGGRAGARGDPAPWTRPRSAECRDVFTISRNVADRLSRYNGLARDAALSAAPAPRAATAATATATTSSTPGRLDRLKRLDLAIDAMKRARAGARLKIAGTGPLAARSCAKQIEGLGVERPRRAARLRLRRGARRALRRVPRRLLRAPQRGLRLRDGGGVPLAEARRHHHRRGRAARVRGRRRERASWPRPTRRRWRAAIDRLCALPGGAARARWARPGTRGSPDITWDHVIDRLTEACALKLAVWSPLPPSPSGIADYVAEQLPALARHFEVQAVVADPASSIAALSEHRGGAPPRRRRPTSTSTTSATRPPTPTSIARRCARPGVVVPPRLEPAPPRPPRDGRAGRRRRPTCARCGAPTARRAPSWAARWRARSAAISSPRSSR